MCTFCYWLCFKETIAHSQAKQGKLCVSGFLGKGPECPCKETDKETKSFKANFSRKDVMKDKRSSLLV